jgi:MGT family glycosyltransferase
VVVTTGPSIAPDALAAPANATIARFVPHQQVLPRASIVVTHGGLGTVMAALSQGVPMVCVPMGRDQFFNAAMVERLGAGRTVTMDADCDTIRGVVEGILEDPQAKAAAKAMAGVIAGYGGGADAVRELEELATRR